MTEHLESIWSSLREEADEASNNERLLVAYLQETILGQRSFEAALSYTLASKLKDEILPSITLRDLFLEILESEERLREVIRVDLHAVRERDPAAAGYLSPFLFFKGFSALSAYRFANHLWYDNRRPLALYLQSLISRTFGVDIHPAATVGSGILIDHATGVVIGETAVVGDNVSLLHNVTLGGTGKDRGDRHPKVGNGVLIAAGAKVLGNIRIGEGAKIGAGSVVLRDVKPHSTVVGVPAKVVGACHESAPALGMNQQIDQDEVVGFDPGI
ncbi:serine O-acetyltransferase [Pelagicoccus sp. SDUM812003]|uniref:serine O-acetyltransferase n=1 Tax=Pelagicoccus sp. SDUM812003 TaxID=3041267 RepID=UPI00280C96D0|nr:serine O-acetyltransferase [Pelagicoccus sp. SDUM812003]MDQ8203446.1 serine O-acetyltransferase [Pelagicoccus sp. SDUM812003]